MSKRTRREGYLFISLQLDHRKCTYSPGPDVAIYHPYRLICKPTQAVNDRTPEITLGQRRHRYTTTYQSSVFPRNTCFVLPSPVCQSSPSSPSVTCDRLSKEALEILLVWYIPPAYADSATGERRPAVALLTGCKSSWILMVGPAAEAIASEARSREAS
jgi:hypothetical protein